MAPAVGGSTTAPAVRTLPAGTTFVAGIAHCYAVMDEGLPVSIPTTAPPRAEAPVVEETAIGRSVRIQLNEALHDIDAGHSTVEDERCYYLGQAHHYEEAGETADADVCRRVLAAIDAATGHTNDTDRRTLYPDG